MIHVYHDDLMRAIAIAANDQRVPEDKAQALRFELESDPTGQGYAQYLEAESFGPLVSLLARPYSIPNPEPQGLVRRSVINPKDLRAFLNSSYCRDESGVTASYKIRQAASQVNQLGFVCDALLEAFNYDAIDPDNPDFEAGLGVLLHPSVGFLTQEQVDGFMMIPDPAYLSVIDMPSRLDAIGLGLGCVVSARDIQEVLA